MGKKKKKEAKPSQRDSQKVDERLKQVMTTPPPEQNDYKLINDDNIDRFLRFGVQRHTKKFGKMTIREQNKFNRRSHRREAPRPWLRKKR